MSPIVVGMILVLGGLAMMYFHTGAKYPVLQTVVFWLGLIILVLGVVILITPILIYINGELRKALGVG